MRPDSTDGLQCTVEFSVPYKKCRAKTVTNDKNENSPKKKSAQFPYTHFLGMFSPGSSAGGPARRKLDLI